jgi:hypothetical protein
MAGAAAGAAVDPAAHSKISFLISCVPDLVSVIGVFAKGKHQGDTEIDDVYTQKSGDRELSC